ncbi:MarR family winged helix-turn-helix transcriptional regulator [Yinghuangia aomiensis]|uniref:MarR family winged helix-turn-helix transcriptional regulator n=1 Tax=Yinghuangia aomiensis TaxID=676205 RepID=UPI0031ECC0B6
MSAPPPAPRDVSLENVHRALEALLAATRSTRLHRELAARAGGNLTRTEAFALGHIVAFGPLRLSALAELTGQDRSIASRQVDTLVKGGLVRREADPDDGRAQLLHATDEGVALSQGLRGVWSDWLARSLDTWTDGDLETLAATMSRFGNDLRTPKNG